ncbi:hypothetical protein RM863_29190 [Streptomyces sp. DSM 41014]|uniref:Uncharacterized protein n=1 Tax=Streptomyces hintoniae TaxID=3075521 RepID=A0ABU2USE2_9ACTN|nr:hypothetical protein [Streptomyces sp. DSM 41014]MDT0476207.1 hypothetical protein [Streptomyces sp. DSM 41014]
MPEEYTTQDGRAQQVLRALLHLVLATRPDDDPDAVTVTITHHRTAAGQPHQDTWTATARSLSERLAEATDLDEGLRLALQAEREARRRLQAEHDAALDLAAAATGWRLSTGHGDAAYGLSVQSHPTLGRYAVIEGRSYALRGLRAYTPDGWQFLQLLEREQVFCWPDAHTALTHARSLLADPPDGITRRIAPTQTLQDDRSQDGGEPR